MLLFQSVRALALELLKLSKDIFNNSNTKMPLHPGCYCKKNLAICYSKFRYGLHNLKSLILFMLSLFSQLSLSLSNSLSLSLSLSILGFCGCGCRSVLGGFGCGSAVGLSFCGWAVDRWVVICVAVGFRSVGCD